MSILGLGYITIKSDKISDWIDFSSNYLGMQIVDKTKSIATLRMDDRKQRFVITNDAKASNIFGWEVKDQKSLDNLAGRLIDAGIDVVKEPDNIAEQRCVKSVISFADPMGNRSEIFYGPEITTEKFRLPVSRESPRCIFLADSSLSRGSNVTVSTPGTLDASIPAFAHMKP